MCVYVNIFMVTIQIYFEENPVPLKGLDKIETIDDIARLIKYVSDNVFACQKVNEMNK